MVKEKLRYNKIKNFIENLNTREKRYIIKQLQSQIMEQEVNQIHFTINETEEVNI